MKTSAFFKAFLPKHTFGTSLVKPTENLQSRAEKSRNFIPHCSHDKEKIISSHIFRPCPCKFLNFFFLQNFRHLMKLSHFHHLMKLLHFHLLTELLNFRHLTKLLHFHHLTELLRQYCGICGHTTNNFTCPEKNWSCGNLFLLFLQKIGSF